MNIHADTLPFCQRNIRLWLALLGACSLAVLLYSIWLALSRSGVHGNHPRVTPGPAGSPSAHAAPASYAVASPIPAAPPADGVGFSWVARGPAAVAPSPDLQSSFRKAASLIRPAVVSISAVRLAAPRAFVGPAGAPRFVDPFDGVPDRVVGNVPYESVGSGLIVDTAGHLVTNDHLVSGASSFLVSRFHRSNEHLPARLIATDPQSDLALLRIEAPGPFPAAEFADSSKVEVGDWVLAVGNPFGFGHTVTAGIISARRARINVGGLLYEGLLQTDAPINQGSSGGPLCNLSGQVVGINTAIYAPTGVWSGAGFAIPANRVTAFLSARMPAAAAGPPVTVTAMTPTPQGSRPWLGITAIDLTPELATRLSLPGGSGALVTSVSADSPAEEAEIQRGDVITAVGGQPINGAESLRGLLARLQPGQGAALTVWRGGLERSLTMSLAAAPGR